LVLLQTRLVDNADKWSGNVDARDERIRELQHASMLVEEKLQAANHERRAAADEVERLQRENAKLKFECAAVALTHNVAHAMRAQRCRPNAPRIFDAQTPFCAQADAARRAR
jgi:hypothetical protein